MGRRLLMLGAPGAGKGTQAAMVCRALGVPHVSTGEMLRARVSDGTELGRQARAIMEAGGLVSDDIMIAMAEERLGRDDAVCGFLLDGFPRTTPQAEALDSVLAGRPLEMVVNLEVEEEEVVQRIIKRGQLEGRSDDTEETVRNRLRVYRELTEPLITYYEERGIIRSVDGMGTIEEIFARVARTLAEA